MLSVSCYTVGYNFWKQKILRVVRHVLWAFYGPLRFNLFPILSGPCEPRVVRQMLFLSKIHFYLSRINCNFVSFTFQVLSFDHVLLCCQMCGLITLYQSLFVQLLKSNFATSKFVKMAVQWSFDQIQFDVWSESFHLHYDLCVCLDSHSGI